MFFPACPVRQRLLSVPKRLRYFMQRDGAVLNMVLRIFLRVIAQSLQDHCAGAAQMDKTALHIGEVAFIHWGTDWDGAAQPAPDFKVDQRISWRMVEAAILTGRWVVLRPPHPSPIRLSARS